MTRDDDVGSGQHPLTAGTPGILHGFRSYLMQDENGQIIETHSISAGLDYPGVGPELAYLRDAGRLTLAQATDAEALDGLQYLARMEGIIPALESAHAVSAARKVARELGPDGLVVVNVSGRGDKDVEQVRRMLGTDGAAKARAPRARKRPAARKARRT